MKKQEIKKTILTGKNDTKLLMISLDDFKTEISDYITNGLYFGDIDVYDIDVNYLLDYDADDSTVSPVCAIRGVDDLTFNITKDVYNDLASFFTDDIENIIRNAVVDKLYSLSDSDLLDFVNTLTNNGLLYDVFVMSMSDFIDYANDQDFESIYISIEHESFNIGDSYVVSLNGDDYISTDYLSEVIDVYTLMDCYGQDPDVFLDLF